MGEALKDRLRCHYASDVPAPEASAKERAVRLAVLEARTTKGACIADVPLWRFVLGQARFVSPSAWVLQLALLAGLLVVSFALGSDRSGTSMMAVMTGAVLTVAIGVPPAFRSFDFHVDELEYACRHDCMQVLCSRLALFGLADVLWLSVVVAIVPSFAGSDPFRVFLYACTPYFACCAASFHLVRLRRSNIALTCVVAAIVLVAAIWGTGIAFPRWYADVSVLVWTAALGVALALAAYEARRLLSQVKSGLRLRGVPA